MRSTRLDASGRWQTKQTEFACQVQKICFHDFTRGVNSSSAQEQGANRDSGVTAQLQQRAAAEQSVTASTRKKQGCRSRSPTSTRFFHLDPFSHAKYYRNSVQMSQLSLLRDFAQCPNRLPKSIAAQHMPHKSDMCFLTAAETAQARRSSGGCIGWYTLYTFANSSRNDG